MNVRNGLRDIGFKPGEIQVYLTITKLGEATASQIARRADLPRTTVISILQKLAAEGYLTMHRYRGVASYWIESPKALAMALKTKIDVAEKLGEMLGSLYRSDAGFPIATVLDTKSAIKNFIDTTIDGLEKGAVIRTIDAPAIGNYEKVFSENIIHALLKKKASKGILTRTLVPYGSVPKIDARKVAAQPIDIREMPDGISYDASFWLTGNALVHFSGNPPFIVSIRHEAIVKSSESMFEFLWQMSRPLHRGS